MFFSPSEGFYYCPIQSSNWNSWKDTLLLIFPLNPLPPPKQCCFVLFFFLNLHENKNSISMCLALDSDYLWNCCTCASIERGFCFIFYFYFFPSQAFGDIFFFFFVKCDFYVSHCQFQHLERNRKLVVPQIGVVFIVLCGQWQCYSEICRCLEYQYFGCCCILQFIWSLPLSLPPDLWKYAIPAYIV